MVICVFYEGMPEKIIVKNKTFSKYIDCNIIEKRIQSLAEDISEEYAGLNPLFIAILNGSFYFASDLFKQLDFPFELSFIKVSSYNKMESKGEVLQIIGLTEDIAGRHVLIVEDIVDTGLTLKNLVSQLRESNPASIKTITLIFKEASLKYDIKPDFVGFKTDNFFLVGYGLDYDQAGRNYKHIYKVQE